MSTDQKQRPNWLLTFFLALLQLAPIIVAIWISLEANRLAREQLASSEESLQRAYAPILAAENPYLHEVLKSGQPSHFRFTAQVFNASENPAYNVATRVYVGEAEVKTESPPTLPVLFGENITNQRGNFLKTLAVEANLTQELAGVVLDEAEAMRMVIEHEDSFGNRHRQTISYRLAGDFQLAPASFKNEVLGKAPKND